MPTLSPVLLRGAALAAFLLNAPAAASASSTTTAKKRADLMKAMRATAKSGLPAGLKSDAAAKMRRNLLAKATKRESTKKQQGATPAAAAARRLEDDEWADFGFDPADYSIKYAGCSNVKTYSDEVAEEGEGYTVLAVNRFVAFTLCPSDTCSDDGACGSNFGEYIVPLEDYLEMFGNYKEEEMDAYCEYCAQCVYYQEYFYGNRMLEDANNGANGKGCPYYNECKGYADVCSADGEDADQGDDQQQAVDYYAELLACQQFDDMTDRNGNPLYVGPMCDGDGGMKVGVFTDENCYEDAGSTYDISGYIPSDALSEYVPSDCVSCRESDNFYMIIKNDEMDDDSITELCENLYSNSAKCNRYLYAAEDGSYEGYNQEANEDSVCDFIESVMGGGYDEAGDIIIRGGSSIFFRGGQATAGQITLIFFLVLATGALAAGAMYIHRKLQEGNPLKEGLVEKESEPRLGDPGLLTYPVERIDSGESGVMAGRAMT